VCCDQEEAECAFTIRVSLKREDKKLRENLRRINGAGTVHAMAIEIFGVDASVVVSKENHIRFGFCKEILKAMRVINNEASVLFEVQFDTLFHIFGIHYFSSEEAMVSPQSRPAESNPVTYLLRRK